MSDAPVRAEQVAVVMPDGVELSAEVVAIDDGVARPVLLLRTPYSQAASRSAEDPVGLARLGWSVVIQDVRGRFESQGIFDPFRQEAADGAATIDWCAKQPWCDGRVVSWGGSYVGATQLLAASTTPPALRAISPTVTTAWYDDGWHYEGGALALGVWVPWFLAMAGSDPRKSDEERLAVLALAAEPAQMYRQRLADHPVRSLMPASDAWLARDPATWAAVAAGDTFERWDLPGFHVAGWFDLFCEGSLRTFTGLAKRSATARARAGQRLVVGPWTHAGLFLDATAEVMFGPAANGLTIRAEMLTWLRRAIDGDEVDGGVRLFVMGTNEWRDYAAWPPPSRPVKLWLDAAEGANSLSGDGVLTWEPPAREGQDTFDYDPDNPVPTRGGRTLGPYLPGPGPVDQRPVEERDDVLVYTSELLSEPHTVIGTVKADISFATTGRSADVTVKLVDVFPDGRALNVVDSVRRARFEPDRPETISVEVGSTAITFLAGHRIRVEVSSSNFPRLDRNPSTGVPAGEAMELEGARQTVFRGRTRPSSITLPVVDG